MRTILSASALLGAAFLPACVMVGTEDVQWDTAPAVEHYSPPVTDQGVVLPFSKGVRVGDTIYLSGELGIDYSVNTLVPGGTGPETTQIFANVEMTLAHFGAGLEDIVKCTVFLDDMGTFAEMNAAYTAALPDPKPARSTFGADGLALGAALEIECIAVSPR
ncbi:MAG: hypothetical protein KDA53_15830 [Hyphomonas sp.]|nr:hypothetical protein [Hyphomonas sp.]